MKSLCSFLIVALAVATSMFPSVRAADCTDACMSCKVKGACDASGVLSDDGVCPTAEACDLLNGIPSCVPFAQTSCDCDGGSQGCDPIDNTKIIYCVRGKLFSKGCPDGQQCIGTGECVATTPAPETPPPPMCKTAFTGFSLITPDCKAALFCFDGSDVDSVECKETEYFDLKSGSCMPYPPPKPCGCGMAKCPVIGDCSNYLLCNGDQVLDEETCSVDGKTFFDPATGGCVDAATGVCADYVDCELPEISYTPETTSASSSTSVTVTETTPTTTPAIVTTTASNITSASVTTPASDITSASVTTPASDITSASVTTQASDTTSTSITTQSPTTTQAAVTTPTTTTTSKPATCSAANAGKRYPHETDCKKYYVCRETTRGRYEYVPSKCPGNLVFDKVSRYCDLPQNVPDCQQ